MITDKFIFIHFPKTAGTSHRSFIKQLADKERIKILGDFGERSARAIQFMNLYKFAFIRNPWAWYVSRYFWFIEKKFKHGDLVPDAQMTKGIDKGIQDVDSIDKVISFKDHMINGFENDRRRGLFYLYKNNEIKRKNFLSGSWPEEPFFSMYGCYRDMLCDKYGKIIVDFIGRIEDFPLIAEHPYQQCGVDLNDLNFSNLNKERKTEHEHYSEYYDEDLLDLVWEFDSEIIEKSDYKFGE